MFDNSKLFDNDDFWDLSAHSRKKTNNVASVRHSYQKPSVEAVEIKLASMPTQDGTTYKDIPIARQPQADGGSTITKVITPVSGRQIEQRNLLIEYKPQNPLIKDIKIYTDKGNDSIFAKDNLFLRERKALLSRGGKEAPHVPFYSMMPRYSQMTRPQLAYYLWWRENIRRGVWLDCDLSYAILYAHELIASDGDEDRSEILKMLCKLYLAERGDRKISFFGIGNLISDFCIIHKLALPAEFLGDKFSEFMAYTSLPEFFIDLSDRYDPSLHEKIMLSASLYNYRKSKHYPGNEQIFAECMSGAMARIFACDKSYDVIIAFSRGAYGGVMASHKPFFKISGLTCKDAKIEIDYYPLSCLQAPVTDAVRYIENKIRDHLGIKSKLNITTVNPDIKAVIDEYMAEKFPPLSREEIKRAKENKTAHEYDRLYDAPKVELSLDRALEIEQSSWQTTKILVEAFEDEPEDTAAENVQDISPLDVHTSTKAAESSQGSSLLEEITRSLGADAEFINLCILKDLNAQRTFTKERSISADELAEQINCLALDIIGDILLEDTGDGYAVIQDYMNLL